MKSHSKFNFKDFKDFCSKNKQGIKAIIIFALLFIFLGFFIGKAIPSSAAVIIDGTTSATIEGGTYRFNDTLTVLQGHDEVNQVEIPISFYSVGVTPPSEGSTVIEVVPTLYTSLFFTQLIETSGSKSLLMCYEGDQYGIDPSVYSYKDSSWGSFFTELINLGFTINGDYSKIHTITVTEDTTFTDTDGIAFATWFSENTTQETTEEETITIPPGTYKWNDVLTIPSFLSNGRSYNFELPAASYGDITYIQRYTIDNQYVVYTTPTTNTIRSIQLNLSNTGDFSVGYDETGFYYYYSTDNWGWRALQYQLSNFGVRDTYKIGTTGQTFTIERSLELPSSFGNWLMGNIRQVNTDDDGFIIRRGYYTLVDNPRGIISNSIVDDQTFTLDISFISNNSTFTSIRYFQPMVNSGDDSEPMYLYYGNDLVFTRSTDNISQFTNIGYKTIFVTNDFVIDDFTSYDWFVDNFQRVTVPDGYDEDSYQQGFIEGINEGFFANFFGGIIDGLDRLVLFGDFSLLDIIKTILGIFIAIWFLRLLAGG